MIIYVGVQNIPTLFFGAIWMDKTFYTNVVKYGNNILFRGVKNGRRIKLKIQYAPKLFLVSNKETEWKSLQGDYLEPIHFENIREANDFVKKYEDVSNFKVYGNTGYAYTFIADEYPGMVDWDIDHIAIDVLDIEVGGGIYANDSKKVVKIRKKS